jgi:hypothetical protein
MDSSTEDPEGTIATLFRSGRIFLRIVNSE